MTSPFPLTFSPIAVGHLRLANRLCHVATLTNFAEANRPSRRHADYYAARARGDAGTLILEHLYSRQQRRLTEIDTVVLAGGYRPVTGLGDALRGKVHDLHLIGDCYAPRKAAAAVHEGHRAGRSL